MSAYPYLDSQNIAIKQDVSFPALGGVDLVTDKLSVNPGTLQDCLNYEVGTEPGYKQLDGLMRYAGRSYNVVNKPVCGSLSVSALESSVFEYFRFEEGSGTVTTGEKGQTATLDGDIDFAGSLVFGDHAIDGDQPASTGGNVTIDQVGWLSWTRTNPFSVSLWFNETRDGPRPDLPNYIFGPRTPTTSSSFGPWRIATSSSGNTGFGTHPVENSILFELEVGGAMLRLSTGPQTKSLNTTYHVVVTFDGANRAELWVDGVLQDSTDAITSLSNSASDTQKPRFFSDTVNESLMFLGRIDETAIFDKALTSNEIVFLYNEGLGRQADRTFYHGGEYKVSLDDDDNNEFIGEVRPIKLEDESLCYQILDGTRSALYSVGDPETSLRVYPNREDTDTYAKITNQAVVDYSSVDDFITKYYDHNKGLAADSFKPPGSGPITSLFELDDMVYATRDNEAGDAGKLYKTTDLPDLAKDVEWEEIDLGLTLDFKNGRTDPLTIYDKEFLELEPEPSNPVLNRLGTEAESVATLDLIGSSLNATTTTGAWATPEHALDDGSDDVVATAFRQHASINVWYQTQILRITGFDVGRDASKFARVVGVKADVSYGYKTFLMSGGEGQFRMKSAHLTNVGGSDNKRDDTIRTQTTADGDMFYTSTLGGPTDDWNPGDPSIENFFDEDFGVDLVFEGRWISGSVTSSSQGNRFYVRWAKLSVYFEDGSERVYFWNGTSDVAEADVLDTQVESGSWENDDAKGTFTLYNAVTPENIVPDLEIRSAPLGAGAYIADTDGVTTSGVFPTSTQINDENAFVQTIKSNFYMDEAKEAIYGVTGAGPAFTFDGKYMRQIRAPVPKEKDKPRHIANHQDHLVLGFKSGSILVSVAGEPTLFDGVEGASEWGFGSRITGLLPLKGNALAVFTRDSTHAFIGNSLENFTTQYISKTSGALEYSVVNMGQPIYCDNFGISNIGVTEQYGDFNWNKISRSISPWIQGAIQESSGFMYNYPKIVTALPIRHKNQYRLYFTDGTNMTMTMAPVPEGDFPMFTFHNYAEGNDFDERHFVPTAALSTILSDGRELIMLGDRHGDVYVLEQGTGILTNSELIPYDSYLIFNPFNGDMPVQNIKYNQAFVHLKHSGQQELTLSAGVNYLQPIPNTFNDTVEGITPLGGIHFDLVPDKIVAHLPSVTDGFSLRINSVGNGNLPHIVQAITYKVAPSSSKNAAPNRY